MSVQLYHGDCLDVLRAMPDNSVDSVVTDPPYGISFMGRCWDYDVPGVEVWAECLRVLKPGGHLLAFAGTRIQHRMAVRIEDAGFEIRDMIAWVYGSGFPKSRNIASDMEESYNAAVWQGWGTALKPALEPITMARKPLAGTVAANVLEHGTGALNIDGCRVGEEVVEKGRAGRSQCKSNSFGKTLMGSEDQQWQAGRWPANLIHDGSPEVLAGFPVTTSGVPGIKRGGNTGAAYGAESRQPGTQMSGFGDTGSAARFFYCAKASRADRNAGLPSGEKPAVGTGATMREREDADWAARNGNHHPTVKPTDLMAYLVRLVTPPGGVVLDPFMGSGSTGKAALREGFGFIGIERELGYFEIARHRVVTPAQRGLEFA